MPVTLGERTKHTSWFNLLARQQENPLEYALLPNQLRAHIKQGTLNYQTLAALLHEVIDVQFNIKRKYDASTKQWIPDDAQAIAVAARKHSNSPVVVAHESLLRSVRFLMTLDALICERYKDNPKLAGEFCKKLRIKFAIYAEEMLNTSQAAEGSNAEKLAAIQAGEQWFATFAFDVDDWFDLLAQNNPAKTEYWLDYQFMNVCITDGKLSYQMLMDLLRTTNDAQFCIVSYYDELSNTWIRDATCAIPLANRIPHDDHVIEVNNTLLRCLSRLRPIEYAIQKKHGENSDLAIKLTTGLRNEFARLSSVMLKIAQADAITKHNKLAIFKKFEKEFNTILIATLYEANLTQGCDSANDAEQLLFYYRNLAASLEPARNLMTLTYDDTAQVLTREIQYPVTKKTSKQQETLKELRQQHVYPLKHDKNSHTSKNIAMQEADQLFADLLIDDDRLLAAQARKTHLVGAKNAYIVKVELIPMAATDLAEQAVSAPAPTDDSAILWLARAASPVYLGHGETDLRLQEHTVENIQQIRQAAQTLMEKPQLAVHVTTLNTNTRHKKQDKIIKYVDAVTRYTLTNNDDVSHLSTNTHGTFFDADVAPGLGIETLPVGAAPLQKATRVAHAVDVCLATNKVANTINLVHCASGQDRTGTVVEKTIQQWTALWYQRQGFKAANIDNSRAQGGNAAEVASHLVPGSPGMKRESRADNFFGDKKTFSAAASQEFYRKSADFNKKNKVGDVAFLNIVNAILQQEYCANLIELEKLRDDPANKNLQQPLQQLIKRVKALGGNKGEKVTAHDLSDLNLVLSTSIKAVHSRAANAVEHGQNMRQMAALSKKFNNKSQASWRLLGNSLLILACAALVVVGTLAAVPTGGSSLLLTVVGAVGLTAAVAGGGGVVATLGLAGAGCRFFSSYKEKRVASAVTKLQELIW